MGVGKDFTLFAMVPGVVKFETKRGKEVVSVYPATGEENKRGREDGKQTRRERRLAHYKPRAAVREVSAQSLTDITHGLDVPVLTYLLLALKYRRYRRGTGSGRF